ncbi:MULTISPECIES: glutamate synthase subunit beta [unclassified Mucilaginibacter]|uniref:glutamate synthase subunit beta n=1 Tax=unclassified Mucilaginibacter TaxID=2617802 RepID=UPI002AC8A09E|nr:MULTISPECIES: glutamate synthase subunit beta [unclassified Mucilaginibacter]MEB0263581.1 glutamate synthase subunit beta [Mucilaginibacter sp. 10I4]MEB0280743.1 glutamate synthase subunit beta [Mucilaginibacter sp. 10B2]MEB0301460.1 glutamate synthase subunit beta [Mucilaginibacter sp. 5C4]WPX22668.1 glutamate synthase subunit beta [Mucilaginibacter sp. 5C4]
MGKVTGFQEFNRELPQKTPVVERVKNYNEFVGLYSDEKLNQQSARCMNCGIPFCHSGCPLGNVIPEFNDAVYRKNWDEAYQILSSTNNFPEFTGRICPAPCESACVLGINKPPVAIEEIEKHIIEVAYSKNMVKPVAPLIKTGKKVAVIGSGPAGLAAAAQLSKAGHAVTVFERDDRPGGLLRYGIPDFKLEKWVIDRRIQIMEEDGIEFKCNAEVGKNVAADEVLRNHHAVVLAGGSTIPRNLPIPGREFKGVYFAMDFLKQQNKRVSSIAVEVEDIFATDKDVVVIGGGDTGSDCVGTSNRQGARSVRQFEVMVQPPEQRTPHMPWPTYPMVLKTTSSHEEGVERSWGINTKEFLGDAEGNLRALKVTDVSWEIDVMGRPIKFNEVEGSEREIPCQRVFLAMGFVNPQFEGTLEQLGVELDERKNVKAKEGVYRTNVSKVFAAGDIRRGQSLVVWAISEGREAARKVDEFLMGHSNLESKDAVNQFDQVFY